MKCVVTALSVGLAGMALGLMVAHQGRDSALKAQREAETNERTTAEELSSTRAKLSVLEDRNDGRPPAKTNAGHDE